MAHKISKEDLAAAAAKSPADDGTDAPVPTDADVLGILHPERSLRLRDRMIELREYGFFEGLTLQSGIQPFLDALFALFARDDAPPTVLQVRTALVAHATTVQWLIAQAMTPYPDDPAEMGAFAEAVAANVKWGAQLTDVEGELLLAAWWSVNRGFFIRRLRELLLQAAVSASASDGSTPH